MKTSHSAAAPAALALSLAASFAMSTALHAQTDPSIPVGNLDAFPTIVQTGTHPTLTWDIEYPSTVIDVIDIIPPGTIEPKEDLYMDVRIVGTGVTRAYTNRYGQVYKTESVVAECWMRFNSSYWNRMFQGNLYDVNPNEVVFSSLVHDGYSINFGGRYLESNNHWSTFYSSENSNTNVIALKDGDEVPDRIPDWGAPSLESFLVPYLGSDGKIDIGPMDVFYVMELTHTNQNHSGFDLQDMIVLVTFRRVPAGN